jgi:1,2-diacylglycerol 3-alpha-glucosyltransferase
MKIVHFCISQPYVDDRSYQENELARHHVKQGHDVQVIASTETHGPDGHIIYIDPGSYLGSEGALVIRLPYVSWLPQPVGRKLRFHPGVYRLMEAFGPDVILFHGGCGGELLTVSRYVGAHPKVRFFIDSHEDWNNSARKFLSRDVLHRLFYGPILRWALPRAEKLLCISTETMDFVHDLYKVPRDRLEFFPLGGRPIPDSEYADRRLKTRQSLGLHGDTIALVQSGKQTKRKKLIESLAAFREWKTAKARLFIAGTLDDEIRDQAMAMIEADERVTFLGWQPVDDLTNLLCASDIYLQPGTQSATMQHALCCRCAIILDDVPAHQIYHRDNGWLIQHDDDLHRILREIDPTAIERMQLNSFSFSEEFLDYEILSRRILDT